MHFPESAHSDQKFFRKGIIDEWKTVLPINIIKEIEKEYKEVLINLKYI